MEASKVGGHDFYFETDMKIRKRPGWAENTAGWEDGILYFAWQDEKNNAKALFYNTTGPKKDPWNVWEGLGLSGFYFMVDGKAYGWKTDDDPGDPIEEIPAATCIPYVDGTRKAQ